MFLLIDTLNIIHSGPLISRLCNVYQVVYLPNKYSHKLYIDTLVNLIVYIIT